MSASDWKIISTNDLADPITSGEYVRAYCHCHHHERPRSLEINPTSGFGHCFRCDDQVLVREWNRDAAETIERVQSECANGNIKVRDPKYIKTTKRIHKPVFLKKWQQEELVMLRQVQVGMERLLQKDERAKAYIAARGLSLESAKAHHIGYIPATLLPKYKSIEKWRDHIVFPVHHPEYGLQFAGRNLHLWQPGMDENEHKELLAPLEEQGILRWRKTHAGGWFNKTALEATSAIFVEGAFDALALIEAGLTNTLAMIGTSVKAEWVPAHLIRITLAFDGDAAGLEKAKKARDSLYIKGYEVEMSSPPTDEKGTDWSERYRLHNIDGLAPLFRCVISTCTQPVVYHDATGDWWCKTHEHIANYESDLGTCSQCESTDIEDVDDEGMPYCMLHRPVLEAAA